MKIIAYTLFLTFLFAALPGQVYAQYRGAVQFSERAAEKKKKDPATAPVPKIFSSQVSSTKEAEKLDIIYNNLHASLWNFAGSDFIYQKKLYDLLKLERFKLTRYPAEFKGLMEDSMGNLNTNYKTMQSEIATARQSYVDIKEGIREADYEVLDVLWEEKLTAFETHSEAYFKMQHAFLKTYKSMVKFIIKQGGSYYYKPASRSLHFYQNSGKQYFGKTLDKLRRISFEQRKHIKSKPPANVDPTYIK